VRPSDRLLTAVKLAEQATQSAKDDAVRSAGLTKAQYNVLLLLSDAPGITNAELARRAFVTPQAMSETVARLERSGHLERTPHSVHRHVLESRVTASGRRALATADAVVLMLEHALRAELTGAEAEALAGLLARVTRAAAVAARAVATPG